MGVIFAIFAILPYSRKLPPRENKTHMTLLKEIWVESWKLPHVKSLANIFAKFSPSENNHVYSRLARTMQKWQGIDFYFMSDKYVTNV